MYAFIDDSPVVFQSAPPRGGRLQRDGTFELNGGFQSAPPRGGRPGRNSGSASRSRFQSAPPRGGRHLWPGAPRIGDCFNPRPREGGDRPVRIPRPPVRVSIRAPARGATSCRGCGLIEACVSIRAPARGATSSRALSIRSSRFQSAPPRGGRPSRRNSLNGGSIVSIRAPARGATRLTVACGTVASVSIRAPARGATRVAQIPVRSGIVSIRAPARGATCPTVDARGGGQFQSAPPRGGRRDLGEHPAPELGVSIRAPARGATELLRVRAQLAAVSIRAPARGATYIASESIIRVIEGFNPRPREGGDASSTTSRARRPLFQSAPPRGGRLRHHICLTKNEKLNRLRETGCLTMQATRRRTYSSTII